LSELLFPGVTGSEQVLGCNGLMQYGLWGPVAALKLLA
jgi:hypothetical protein